MITGASSKGPTAVARWAGVVLALVVVAGPVLAGHDKTDRVTTDDGGVYVGEIKSIQYATVTLDTDPAGTVSIEWRKVTSVTSKYPYRIELAGGVKHYGSLGPAKEPGRLSIVGSAGTVDVALSDVVSIQPFERKFWRSLDGSINFGLTYTQSSDAFQYNFSANLERRTRKHYSTLVGQSIFNTQQGAEASSQYNVKFVLTQITRHPWYPFEMAQLQSNPSQGYDLRSLVGAGASNFFVERSHVLASVNLGLVYDREVVSGESSVDNSVEAMAGISYRRFKRGSHSPSVQLGLETFTTIGGERRIRGVFTFVLGWNIIGDFDFSFQVNESYDSNPPGTDANKNDLTVVTAVGYSF